MIHFTSDLHLGHANILKYEPGRPHSDVEQMNTDIVQRLASALTPQDELWLLGDLYMGPRRDPLELLEAIGCPMVWVAGNHDRFHAMRNTPYLPNDRVVAVHAGGTQLELPTGRTVQVNHFPYPASDERIERDGDGKILRDRYANWRPKDRGGWLLCGHVHSRWRQQGRQINVGIDAWAGLPVSMDQIVELMKAGPRDLPVLQPWEPHPARVR